MLGKKIYFIEDGEMQYGIVGEVKETLKGIKTIIVFYFDSESELATKKFTDGSKKYNSCASKLLLSIETDYNEFWDNSEDSENDMIEFLKEKISERH